MQDLYSLFNCHNLSGLKDQWAVLTSYITTVFRIILRNVVPMSYNVK